MFNLACRACGITLSISPEMSVGVCPRCGTKLVIPKLDSQQKADVYTKLAAMMREKKFEQAANVTQQLIKIDAMDPAAYWELLMAKYGIAYAQKGNEMVPAPGFVGNTLIVDDPIINTMMNYASPDKRAVFREETLRIAQAQINFINSVQDSMAAVQSHLQMGQTIGNAGMQQGVGAATQGAESAQMYGDANRQKNVYFIDSNVKKRIEGEIDMAIGDWPESEEETYTRAYGMLRGARYEADFKQAAYYFSKIKGYKNASALYDECIKRLATSHYDTMYNMAKNYQNSAMTEADINKAISLYEQIKEWKDSALQISLCQKKIMDLRREEKVRAYREEQEREERQYMVGSAAKGFFKVVGIPAAILVVIFLLGWTAYKVWAPGIKYQWAMEAKENRKYIDALEIFEEIRDYKDSEAQIEDIINIDKSFGAIFANVGDTVTFGEHVVASPNGNGIGELEWKVVDKVDGKLLLVSVYGIDSIPYNRITDGHGYWNESHIRDWLNNEFIVTSFSPAERSLIAQQTIKTDFSVSQLNEAPFETRDRVFLLSAAEMSKYLTSPDDKKMRGWSVYLDAYPKHYNEDGLCMWWLRDAGNRDGNAVMVNQFGYAVPMGTSMSDSRPLVRPAIWITVEKLDEKK